MTVAGARQKAEYHLEKARGYVNEEIVAMLTATPRALVTLIKNRSIDLADREVEMSALEEFMPELAHTWGMF